MRIGYVGLGAMGGALARRLVASGELTVWDINADAVTALGKLGAATAHSAAELALSCDIVLLCLPRSSDVRELVLGSGGLAEGLRPGCILVDQTSGIPGETRAIEAELVKRGVTLIDAPVSGGVAGAAAGTIAIMVSGPNEICERVLPVLTRISPNVSRCGDRVGDAQAMKLVNNMLSAGARLATLEIVAVGRKMGLSLVAMTEVINKGLGRNRTSKVMLQQMADGKTFTANFAMALMVKDMNQAIQLSMDCGAPTPIVSCVRSLLQAGVGTLGEGAQLEDIVAVIEAQARARIVDPAAETAPPLPVATPDANKLRVGYVGLGAMGGALTRRLMLSRKVMVFDARTDVMRSFAAEGAEPAADLTSLARDCDVIFVCVPTSDSVREVIFGEGGLAEGLAPGKIIVDQTSGDPTITRAIAARLQELGVALVDAPVSGGPRGAVAGTIAIICGGPPDAFATVLPILDSVSPNSVYCGSAGNGHVAKLIQNTVASCNRLLTYEAAAVGVKYGLKLADMSTVINKGTGWSGATERILPTLSERKPTADFQLALMAKDLKLATRMAMDCGAPMLIGGTVRTLFEAGSNQLGGNANLDEMARLYENMADIQFQGA